jgi:hypothetical protein
MALSKAGSPAMPKPAKGKPAAKVGGNVRKATRPTEKAVAADPAQRAVVALCTKQDNELDASEERLVASVRAFAAAVMAHPALLDVGPAVGAAIAGGPALPMLIQRFVAPMLATMPDPTNGEPVQVDLRWYLVDRLYAAQAPQPDSFWVLDVVQATGRSKATPVAPVPTIDPRQAALF